MNVKKISIILLAMLFFIMFIGVASATQNMDSIKTSDNATVSDNNAVVKKVDTEVDADDVAVVHKKKGYFKVKVKDDDSDRPVKNLKLKLKVFTKSKSKTYQIKTNSKGIAKFNTKDLKIGKHKVIVTSLDDKYPVNKKAKIYVGLKKTVDLKVNSYKKLKNKDKLRVYTKYDDDDKELKVAFKGTPKHTILIKAKFYLKNKATGKVIIKTDIVEFDDGRCELPDADYSNRFTPTKIKVSYISY